MDVDSNEVDQNLLQQKVAFHVPDQDKSVQFLPETAERSWFLRPQHPNDVSMYRYFERMPSMQLLRDVTIGQGESIPPCTEFVYSCLIKNNGDAAWPAGCCLQFKGGDLMATTDRVGVLPLAAEGVMEINLEMVSPSEPGIYRSKFRMATTTGAFFGDIIRVNVTVAEGGTMSITQQLTRLSELGSSTSRVEPNANPFTTNRTSSQILYKDDVQQSQEGDTNMMR